MGLFWTKHQKKKQKRHMYRSHKNFYHFSESVIPVINLIVSSRNVFKFSKIMSLSKSDKLRESFLPNTDNFLSFFVVFEQGWLFWKYKG